MNLSESGIVLKGNSQQQKTQCPNCVRIGKENYKDNCLSVNTGTGLYNCHKCGWSGKLGTTLTNMNNKPVNYIKPKKTNLKGLTNEGERFLLDRGITNEVISANKIVSSKDNNSIVFPYFKNGEMTNYKTRGINGKKFTQSSGSESIIYNYDRCNGQEAIIICEGEFDSLSWEVAGFTAHTSVNMGAPNAGDKSIDRKLECISNCYEVFETAERIFIATDEDENGRRLQQELIRRVGAEKSLLVDLKPYKDANEVLLHEGVESLRKRLESAENPKLEGIFELNSVRESMLDGFHNGQERGTTTHIEAIDPAWTWRSGEVNIWTGYQNEGKSLFVNQLATLKAAMEDWKFAIFSPENFPLKDFYNDIIEMYIGKTSDPHYKSFQMSLEEYNEGMDFCNRNFFMIYPKKNFTLDSILERTKYLVKTKGIRSLIIDPYNTIQHKMRSGEREDLYISRFMSELKRFAIEQDISINLVAHQVTPQKDDSGRYYKPDVNKIKGGGTFADKADNVMTIWRPERAIDFSDRNVVFASQKIKKQKLVGRPQEVANIDFDLKRHRYSYGGVDPFIKVDEARKRNTD